MNRMIKATLKIKPESPEVSVDKKLTSDDQSSIKPFIRWAGGKQNLVKTLALHLPKKKFTRYFEPFLGAGSLFLHSQFGEAILSDINPHLINAYTQIKNSPKEVISRLTYHKNRVSSNYYYTVRDSFNERKDLFTVDQAALFIFLVHTSFNGIYRVNQKGLYNVPFGKLKHSIPSKEHIYAISARLKNARLLNAMYEDVIPEINKGDFVYFDPPYPPLTVTSFFQHYSIDKFPDSQQQALARDCDKINQLGAYVMVSNADTPEIRQYYKGWNIHEVDTFRYVNCKSDRKKVNELIITNY